MPAWPRERVPLAGTVVRGDGRGRRLGFPTANLALDEDHRLGSRLVGVYAAWVQGIPAAGGYGLGHGWPAVVNIGARPTFGGDGATTVEVHLLDYEGDLYGRHLRVTLGPRLRDERAFGSTRELVAQIARDIEAARSACQGQD